ncbi:MAG: HEAT repeat domain-containing protein [Spirochaetes bacterium]|jgi:HEAT repeat protein|nr:HEAT repeat domain-containing protein [Spirochaetota bacterium]
MCNKKESVPGARLLWIPLSIIIILTGIVVNPQPVKTRQKKEQPTKPGKKAAERENEASARKKTEIEKSSDEKKGAWIEKTLDYGINDEREFALNKIATIKDKAIQARLAGKLADVIKKETEMEILKKAITVAGEVEATQAVPAIIERLDDASEDVQIASVYSLGRLKAVSSKDKIIEKLKKQDLARDSNLTEAMITVLGDFKASEINKFAEESAGNNKNRTGIREQFIIFLGKTGTAESGPFLIKTLKNPDEEIMVRAYSANTIAKLGLKNAAGDIKAVVAEIDSYQVKKKKKYYNLYMYSLAALARLGDRDALPGLENALKNNSAEIRLKAIKLIKDFRDKRTIDILKYKMEYDPNPKVKEAAKAALKEMGAEVKD